MGTQETIIYRLVMRNPSYDANFSFSWVTFGGKMGVAATRPPSCLGPSNLTKKLATWWTFWANHYLEHHFEITRSPKGPQRGPTFWSGIFRDF